MLDLNLVGGLVSLARLLLNGGGNNDTEKER